MINSLPVGCLMRKNVFVLLLVCLFGCQAERIDHDDFNKMEIVEAATLAGGLMSTSYFLISVFILLVAMILLCVWYFRSRPVCSQCGKKMKLVEVKDDLAIKITKKVRLISFRPFPFFFFIPKKVKYIYECSICNLKTEQESVL